MIPQRRARQRHERILDAALRVFARKGYKDAAVEDIAAESRTSKGGVYFHFPGKQALFLQLLERTAARLRKKIEAAIAAEEDPLRRADEALLVVLRTFASHRAIARLFMFEALGAGPEFHRRLFEIHEEFAEIIREQLDDAVRQGVIPPVNTQVAAWAWFGALNEVVMRWLLSPRPMRLYDAYEALRPLLAQSVGVREPERRASFPDELRGRVASAVGRALSLRAGQATLVSVTVPCPTFDAVSAFAKAPEPAAFWQQPAEGLEIVAAGEAYGFPVRGAQRFGDVARAWEEVTEAAVVDPGTAPYEAPVALAGFAFRARGIGEGALPDGLLSIPRLLLVADGGDSWLTVSFVVSERADEEGLAGGIEREALALLGDDRAERIGANAVSTLGDEHDLERWRRSVGAILEGIRSGETRKVVLARTLQLRADGVLDIARALRRLAARYPSCTTFAFRRDDACFLGATPERLLRIRDGVINVDCLAGSRRRGGTDLEDAEQAAALLRDAKEVNEHAVVVAAVEEALRPLCTEVEVGPGPEIKSLANVHHLFTPVSSTALPGVEALDLVAALHPTPATGGYPRDAALAVIEREEGFDRGWYAGPVGWFDAAGDGDFVVAIRSALVCGNEATLYAGCGIVPGSDAEREYQEAELKLQPMLWALGEDE